MVPGPGDGASSSREHPFTVLEKGLVYNTFTTFRVSDYSPDTDGARGQEIVNANAMLYYLDGMSRAVRIFFKQI
jgi:hypothetical protein